jgi:putative ABC transport system permease protein
VLKEREMIRNDLKIALRNLRRHAGYSLINILGLAIGMACCILILLYVQGELSYDRYHDQADRIYRVVDRMNANSPHALAPALQNDFPEIEEYTRFKPPFGVWMMRYEDRVFYEGSVYSTEASVFDLINFPLVQGDPNTALQDPNAVVLTESMVRKYFGDENPMGKILSEDDGVLNIRIMRVMKDVPGNTHFSPDFFFSIATMPVFYNANVLKSWDDNVFYTYIRLSPDALPSALEQKLPLFIDKYTRQPENAGAARWSRLCRQLPIYICIPIWKMNWAPTPISSISISSPRSRFSCC